MRVRAVEAFVAMAKIGGAPVGSDDDSCRGRRRVRRATVAKSGSRRRWRC